MTEAETRGATEFVIHVQIVMTGFATVAVGALDALFAPAWRNEGMIGMGLQ